jgi:hypothetical protein
MVLSELGLEAKAAVFAEYQVDGATLVTTTHQELTEDFGLSNLQAKKVMRRVEQASPPPEEYLLSPCSQCREVKNC